jgi:galactonate dehydratase
MPSCQKAIFETTFSPFILKITKLETIHVAPRWLFLKVHTDEGLVGYGEPVVEGRAKTVEMAVRELEGYLIGKDPLQIEGHWQAMYRGTFYRGGPILTSAISGIEQAMWDILGKRLGVPVYQLLGGACRNMIRAYAHVGGYTPEECAENAVAEVERGFKSLKTGLFEAVSPASLFRKAPSRDEFPSAWRGGYI